MRNAYALLGLAFLLLFFGVYLVVNKAEAPPLDQKELSYGEENIISSDTPPMSLTLTSSAFKEGEKIPLKHTCEGENINPELIISGVPEGTKSLVLVMDDPDIPQSVKDARGIEKFNHWVLYNIPADTTRIPENTSVGSEGLTSRGTSGYVGSCPPDREHRYFFRLYALGGTLNFIQAPTLDEVETAAKGMSLASTTLMGRYEKMNK